MLISEKKKNEPINYTLKISHSSKYQHVFLGSSKFGYMYFFSLTTMLLLELNDSCYFKNI